MVAFCLLGFLLLHGIHSLIETFAYILGPGVLFRWSLELTEKLVSERQQAGVVGQPKGAKGGEEEAKTLPMETVPEAAITTANERVLAADDFNSGLGSEPAFVLPACPKTPL